LENESRSSRKTSSPIGQDPAGFVKKCRLGCHLRDGVVELQL
jgi:hypothetical protein